VLSDRCNRRRMERLYTLVQKEKHPGKQENKESSRKEARREASFPLYRREAGRRTRISG